MLLVTPVIILHFFHVCSSWKHHGAHVSQLFMLHAQLYHFEFFHLLLSLNKKMAKTILLTYSLAVIFDLLVASIVILISGFHNNNYLLNVFLNRCCYEAENSPWKLNELKSCNHSWCSWSSYRDVIGTKQKLGCRVLSKINDYCYFLTFCILYTYRLHVCTWGETTFKLWSYMDVVYEIL